MRLSVTLTFILFSLYASMAQTHLQTLRGVITDQETLVPLTGANISIEGTSLGTSADLDGRFEIKDIQIGRHNILITYLGYEPIVMKDVLLTSGKEVVLEISMTESLVQMDEIVVSSESTQSTPLNEMALASARSFSVEETGRYASSLFDPARMAQNFAGVSTTGGSSDLFNEIIVRGNSPRGVLWRLEGIEIPNPNHFGGLGNTGGGISMLSSSLLSSSDFYTGAFPAEFGNATSGAFDLNLRKGNNQKREHAFMLGILGTEVATEGPIGKSGDASYLVNFRYSTLSILKEIGLNPVGDVLPEYGDLSFNIQLPKSKIGKINIFGLAGKNRAYEEAIPDSTQWEDGGDAYEYSETQTVGTVGLSHRYLINDRSYFHTVIAASTDRYNSEEIFLNAEEQYKTTKVEDSRFNNNILRATTNYNLKINARNSIKIGAVASHHAFDFFARDFDEDGEHFTTYLQDTGSAQQFQSYVQWKNRINEKLTIVSGLHANYYALTKRSSIEPRVSLKWQATEKQAISFAAGLHSKPEHPVFYYVSTAEDGETRNLPNRNLDYIKALHLVVGYDHYFSKQLRMKTEFYFQHLFDVPVENTPMSRGSILNVLDVWDILGSDGSIASGRGRNYGVDVTLEKSFSKNYYFLFTGSLFSSEFRTVDKKWYDTRFASKYQVNLLSGKEFKIGRSGNKTIAFNGKLVLNGGNRVTPIDLIASKEKGYTVRDEEQFLSKSIGTYYRLDVGVSYKINRAKTTHSIMLDIQNVSNRLNPLNEYYNARQMQVEFDTHTGLFPVLNYRVEF